MPMEFGQNKPVEEKVKPPLPPSTPKKCTFDMQIQTMPESIKVKDKGFQTKDAEPKVVEELPKKKKLKEKQN